nr:MAG TPA: Large Terminase [Caudoviricetes sp.]
MTWLEEYGAAVLDGRIIACKRIKQVYRILLGWLAHPPDGYIFSEAAANKHIHFIETFCKQAQGKMGTPLRLQLFQKAKLQAIFGFVSAETGFRKITEAMTVEGRKNGKTTETSAIELDMLVNDGEGAPEIYNIATAYKQAKKGFDEAWKMVRQSPELRRHIRKRQNDLFFPYNLGIIQPLASNSDTLDGFNGHLIAIDELAAIKNRDLYDLAKQSFSSRNQPLLICNTTNGFIRNGIFDAQYQYACDWLDGKIQDDHFLPFLYELDDPDEWDDESKWIKANPGLGTIKKLETLRGYVKKAKADPSFKPTVMVKDFNIKQSSATAWLRREEFDNGKTFDIAFDYAIGGFDAADSVDLNAAKAVCMRPDDPNIYVYSMYWIPQSVLDADEAAGNRRERDSAPYSLWVKQGLMRAYPGNKVDKRVFLDWFRELRDDKGLYVRFIGYDPWHIDDSTLTAFREEFGEGCMIPVRQGVFTLSDPMKSLKADLSAGRVIYNNNPIDKMCFYNIEVKTDINGNIQPVKGLDPRRRIDGVIALICAYKVLQDKANEYINLNEGAE